MQITQAELNRRLHSSKNLISTPASVNGSVAVTPQGESDGGQSQVPQSLPNKPSIEMKIVAGSLAKQGVPVREIACEFGISPSQVNSAKNSTNSKIKGPIQNSIARVQELAIDKMILALGLMTHDKFMDASLKDLSIVTSNMAKVIEKTTLSDPENSRVQLIIYAPEPRSERSYRVLDV